jgi:hypothetical protein
VCLFREDLKLGIDADLLAAQPPGSQQAGSPRGAGEPAPGISQAPGGRIDADALPPGQLVTLGLRPIKLSKFLWATLWR